MPESNVVPHPRQTAIGVTEESFVPEYKYSSIALEILLVKEAISRPPEQRGRVEWRQVETAQVGEGSDRIVTCAGPSPVSRAAFHDSSNIVKTIRQAELSDVRQRHVSIRAEQPDCPRGWEHIQNLQHAVAFDKWFRHHKLERKPADLRCNLRERAPFDPLGVGADQAIVVFAENENVARPAEKCLLKHGRP